MKAFFVFCLGVGVLVCGTSWLLQARPAAALSSLTSKTVYAGGDSDSKADDGRRVVYGGKPTDTAPSPTPLPGGPPRVVEIPLKGFVTERSSVKPMQFVILPAGTAMLGSPMDEMGRPTLDELRPKAGATLIPDEPQISVRIDSGIAILSTEVTNEIYSTVTGDLFGVRSSNRAYPVNGVSFLDAQDFCKKLTDFYKAKGYRFRLPTEDEWEYAARAGRPEMFSVWTAQDFADLNRRIAYDLSHGTRGVIDAAKSSIVCSTSGVKPVASIGRPNDWGLYDMHGNQNEWCEWGVARPENFARTGLQPLRGGNWASGPLSCRSAARFLARPETRKSGNGFRIVVEGLAR